MNLYELLQLAAASSKPPQYVAPARTQNRVLGRAMQEALLNPHAYLLPPLGDPRRMWLPTAAGPTASLVR